MVFLQTFVVVSLITPNVVSAYDGPDPLGPGEYDITKTDKLKEKDIAQWIDKSYEEFAYSICTYGLNSSTDVSGILQNFKKWGLSDIMEEIYGVIKLVGAALLVTYFLLELMDKVSKEQFDAEIFIKMYLKFIIAKMIILDNGIDILNAMIDIGTGLQVTVGNIDVGIDARYEIAYVIQNQDMMMDVVIGILGCIPFLIKKLMDLVIHAMCYGVLIDITIRGAFAPIGCVSMVQDGFSGNGMRYLKKFLGACMQGAVILGIVYVCGRLSSNIMAVYFRGNDVFENIADILVYLISSIIVGLTELICITKSRQIAEEAAGV